MTRERLEAQLRACNEALSSFKTKYGMAFAEFAVAWRADNVSQRRSHEVGRDFMEWEARELEQTALLEAVQEFGCSGSES